MSGFAIPPTVLAASSQLPPSFFHNRGPGHRTCIQDPSNFCPGWALDHLSQWGTPTLQHIYLVAVPVVCGFAVAFGMALLAHRRRWLVLPFVGISDILYTIPSLAFFVILIPLTGLGRTSAIVALTCYTLVVLFRTTDSGLANVPAEVKDAGRGMGLTEQQLLWRVELPLALPTIIGGLRIATVSTVAIASLAVFIDAGGLGTQIYPNISFLTGDITTGVILLLLAFALDAILVIAGRFATPWIRAASRQ
jgi:osmoprotectant transport system permease protein